MAEKAKAPDIRFEGFTDAWEQRELGELVDISTGKLDANAMVEDGEYDFYTSGIKKYRINTAAFEGPAITIAGNGATVGYMHLADGKFNAYQRTYVLEGFQADRQFLYSEIGNRLPRKIAEEARTGNIPYIVMDMLTNLNIGLPVSEDEQAKIGAFFKNVDNLITLHQRKLLKLKNVKKAMLEKMFPKNGSNVPEIRFAGFTDAWEKLKLAEIAKEVSRNDPNSTAPIMMITANNGFINQSDRYSFNNSGDSLKKYILLKQNELAYNHGASKIRPYGSCFTLPCEEARIPFVYHCFSVGDNDPEFISTELNSSRVESQLRKIISSGARMDGLLNISFDEYCSVSLMLPGIQEQILLSRFFKNHDNLITLHQRKIEKLKNIKKACLEKMFV